MSHNGGLEYIKRIFKKIIFPFRKDFMYLLLSNLISKTIYEKVSDIKDLEYIKSTLVFSCQGSLRG